jgi:hypothetical protein
LEVIEKNFPLLILAKGKKLREFEEIIKRGLTEYLEVLFQVGVDPDTVMEGVVDMAKQQTKYQINMERFLTVWLEAFPESAHRIAPLREALDINTREALIQAKREALSLLLESKFGQLPEAAVSKLEALREVEELDRLYRLALRAQTLEELGL